MLSPPLASADAKLRVMHCQRKHLLEPCVERGVCDLCGGAILPDAMTCQRCDVDVCQACLRRAETVYKLDTGALLRLAKTAAIERRGSLYDVLQRDPECAFRGYRSADMGSVYSIVSAYERGPQYLSLKDNHFLLNEMYKYAEADYRKALRAQDQAEAACGGGAPLFLQTIQAAKKAEAYLESKEEETWAAEEALKVYVADPAVDEGWSPRL